MDFYTKIDNFLKKKSDKQKIIVIYWPTASWKTWLSIDIAKYVSWEVVSTDSRQIFKYLDIGTWKVTSDEKQWIPHYMLDIIEPNSDYSVWEFKQEANLCIDKIFASWKIPILCWWTWLYIDSLIFDFDIPRIPADQELRDSLEKDRLKHWNQYIWDILNSIDPDYAKELHPNNYRYVIRWIEVKKISGKSKLDFRTDKKLKYDVLFLTPYNGDREYLYSRINKRVQMMFDDWLIDEVKDLLKTYKSTDFWMKTIGYKEVVNYLNWKFSKEECIELVKKHNRNYAKRQLTWFRNYEKLDFK